MIATLELGRIDRVTQLGMRDIGYYGLKTLECELFLDDFVNR